MGGWVHPWAMRSAKHQARSRRREAGELQTPGPHPGPRRWGRGCPGVGRAAGELGGSGRSGGAAGRPAARAGRPRRPGGRARFADQLRHPSGHRAQPPPRYHPHQTPARRPRPAWGASPGEGLEFLPGGPLPPLPAAGFLPLPARPPPGRQPTACPRGRQEATCPRKECRAWRAGGGRWAGPGWQAGSAGPGRLVRGKEPARALPGSPRRPVRRPGAIAASHTFPARHADGAAAGSGAAAGQLRPAQAAPAPLRAPLSSPAPRRGQAVMFPHTPLRRRRLWGPGGEQGAD